MSKPDVLYLVHRLPYPPDKGDKIRSYHILRYLLRRYRVHLGCFVDDPRDMEYVAALQDMCASVCVRRLTPRWARMRSASAFLTGESLSLPYYRDGGMQAWVDRTLADHSIHAAVAFSSPMAQYLRGTRPFPRLMDFVDVDSDKWRQYAEKKRGVARWLYAREADRLLDYEKQVAREFDASVFVSPHETDLFSELSPASAARHHAICNGVDFEYFDPDADLPNPFGEDDEAIVFTGMMDYWPNVDAVSWFAREVFPAIRLQRPAAGFWIVGGAPTPEVRALGDLRGVTVTGRVPDVRPFIKHAATVVAPLRVARGIQNKVLEALAMGKAVACTPAAAAGLDDLPAVAAPVAETEVDLAANVVRCLDADRAEIRQVARQYVIDHYDWETNLGLVGQLLDRSGQPDSPARRQETVCAE